MTGRADEKTSNMDPEQLDFDPEEDDETMLRLKALETQVETGNTNELGYLLHRNSRLRSSSPIMDHRQSREATVRILMFQQQAGACLTILEQHCS